MCALSESRINTDSTREGDSVLPFAPEERYVYSSATTSNPSAPEERNVVLWHTPEPVGVGCPNPSGEATKPLRWMPRLEFWCVGAFRSRGAICL